VKNFFKTFQTSKLRLEVLFGKKKKKKKPTLEGTSVGAGSPVPQGDPASSSIAHWT
jgi:hypothetical protein